MDKLLIPILIGVGFYWIFGRNKSNENNTKPSRQIEKLLNTHFNKKYYKYAQAELANTTYSTETLGWIENNRSNENDGRYPPGFYLSNEAQQIYNLLNSKQLVVKHKVLLEVISMILSQYKFLQSKICTNTMIENRIQDLSALGYKRGDNRYKNLFKKIIGNYQWNNSSQLSLAFGLRSLTLIEDEINKIEIKQNEIRNLVQKIYSDFISKIIKDC